MAAGRYNIIIDQGADFAFDFTVKEDGTPKDLTGYSARAQLRTKKTSTSKLADFTCAIIDAANGVGKVSLPNSITAGLTPGVAYWDLELYTAADAEVVRLLNGQVEITAEVTR